MSESTQNEQTKVVEDFLERLDDFQGFCKQVVTSEAFEDERERRRDRRSWARRLIEEYESMTEEEQKEFEERKNKEGQYSKEQLEEMAESEELLDKEKMKKANIPPRYVSGDIEARTVGEVKKIVSVLMNNYDPVGKEAPNWNNSRNTLKEKHDIAIGVAKLKRYWSAIEEKKAFSLVKQKMYWEIIDGLQDASNDLIQHVMDRVGSDGGDFDKINERTEALVKVIDLLENLGEDDTQKIQVDERKATKTEYVFKDMTEDEQEKIEEDGVIDIEGE